MNPCWITVILNCAVMDSDIMWIIDIYPPFGIISRRTVPDSDVAARMKTDDPITDDPGLGGMQTVYPLNYGGCMDIIEVKNRQPIHCIWWKDGVTHRGCLGIIFVEVKTYLICLGNSDIISSEDIVIACWIIG